MVIFNSYVKLPEGSLWSIEKFHNECIEEGRVFCRLHPCARIACRLRRTVLFSGSSAKNLASHRLLVTVEMKFGQFFVQDAICVQNIGQGYPSTLVPDGSSGSQVLRFSEWSRACGSHRWSSHVHYPLVICYIAIENDHMDVPIKNGDFP